MTAKRVRPTPADPYPVRIVRSRKRKRTVSARLVDGVLELSVPAWLSEREADEFVNRMQLRFARKRASASSDLTKRAAMLAKRYELPAPTSVRWVGNQSARWGSCSVDDGSIRLSDRMIGMPEWVVDAVLVHELAHLVHADHGPAFKELEARFERQVEASAFLEGVVWAAGHRSREQPSDGAEATADAGDDAADAPGSPDERPNRAVARTGQPEVARPDLSDDAVELQALDGCLDLGQLRLDLLEELGREAD